MVVDKDKVPKSLTEEKKGSETPEWSGPTATKFEKCVRCSYLADRQLTTRLCSKAYSEYFDPCQDAAKRSIRCLHRNGGERAMCTDFFQ
jgi:cytochrome c oxidase assembly protein subunit 23